MRLKLKHLWSSLHSTYWFIPSLMAVAAAIAAVVLVKVDRRFSDEFAANLGWIYAGGPEGARAVLSVVASSVMGTAGVTFSITIAALSLASSQLGPRLLYNFMRDRGNQLVLGTFIATFVYCLLVLRTIRGAEEVGYFVPAISVTGGVVLGLGSLAVLIYFIHHVSISIQAPNVVALVGRDLSQMVEREFATERSNGSREEEDLLPEGFDERAAEIAAAGDGYVQALDERVLVELGEKLDALLVVEHRPGHFVVEGAPLVRVWPPTVVDEEVRRAILAAFVLGSRRTPDQDLEFAVDQLVEVAVRALSPGINDPFTAMGCLDWLSAALCRAANGRSPSPVRKDEEGRPRLIHRCPVTFPGLADAAFNQIRQFGTRSPAVMLRMLETIHTVLECTHGDQEEMAILLHHAEMIRRSGIERAAEARDRKDIESRYGRVLEEARRIGYQGV